MIQNKIIFYKKHKEVKIYIRNNSDCYCYKCKSSVTVSFSLFLFNLKLSYQKWFLCLYEFWASKNGLSYLKLSCYLGITKKFAWSMLYKIRSKLFKIDNSYEKFEGIIEMDEVYIQCEKVDKEAKKVKGRGALGKVEILGFANRFTKKIKFYIDDILILKQKVKRIEEACNIEQTYLITNSYRMYKNLLKYVPGLLYHSMINHSKNEV